MLQSSSLCCPTPHMLNSEVSQNFHIQNMNNFDLFIHVSICKWLGLLLLHTPHRSFHVPRALNKAQPWPAERTTVAAMHPEKLRGSYRSIMGTSPKKNGAFNASSSSSIKPWAAPWCYPKTQMLEEQSLISERQAGTQPGLLKLHK